MSACMHGSGRDELQLNQMNGVLGLPRGFAAETAHPHGSEARGIACNEWGQPMEEPFTRSSASEMTAEELKLLERAPRTRMQDFLDHAICFLPTLAGLLAIAEYLYVPNISGARITYTYAIFMAILSGAALVAAVVSFARPAWYEHARERAPFRTLVFLLFLAYDVLTVKTATLPLPYFPWVDQILNAALGDTNYLAECVANSVKLLFTGYFTGLACGLVTGIACGYSKRVSYWIDPFMKLMGAIPSTTWIPVVMVLASSLFGGAVFIIALGVWFSVTIATSTGIRGIDPAYFESARTLGARTGQLLLHVALPAALPSIIQGMIQAMSSACTALLVAEMIGVESGLGWYITWQKSWAQYGKMYAAIVLICILFVIVNFALKMIAKRVLRWKQGEVA